METQALTKIRYHLPELDTLVKTSCEEILVTSKSNGVAYGERNQPSLDNENLASFTEEEYLIAQHAIDEVNRKLQYHTSCHHVIEHKKMTDGKTRDVLNKQAEVKEKQQENAAQLQGKQRPFSKQAVRIVIACTAVLILGDLVFNIKTFEPLGYNFFEAAVISLIFAFLLATVGPLF